MRKLFYFSICFSLCALIIAPLQAMDQTLQSPEKITPYFTNVENDGGFKLVLQSLEKTVPGDEIIVDQFIISEDSLPAMLIKKHKQGVKVSVNVCGGSSWSKSAINRLKEAKIDVFTFNAETQKTFNLYSNFPVKLHKKSIVWYYTEKNEVRHYRGWDGTRNLSHMASAKYKDKETNQEAMIYYGDNENSQEIFESQKASHERTRKTKRGDALIGELVLEKTPKKLAKLQSSAYDICKSLAERIRNTPADGELYISIFAINHVEVMHACLEVAKKGALKTFITDRYTLKKDESVKFLEELEKNGVEVRIFNSIGAKKCGNRPVINHEKMFVRKGADGILTGIGSTNFTTSNNADITDFTLYNDQEFGKQCLKHIDELKKQSSSLADVKMITQ